MTRHLFAVAAVAIAGCGATTWPVTGKVVFPDGEPVRSGVVEFAPAEGGPAARGTIAADGSFALATGGRPGAAAGKYRVVVVQFAVADGAAKHTRPHAHAAVPRAVHGRYRSFETSGLERVVEARDGNDFRIEVEAGR